MSANKRDIAEGWVDPDEIPDLSTDTWAKVVDAASVQCGNQDLDHDPSKR